MERTTSDLEKATAPPAGRHVRTQGPARAPAGRRRLPWYGPGFIWIVASVGSGSVLFTPRVGSRYRYALLWARLPVSFRPGGWTVACMLAAAAFYGLVAIVYFAGLLMPSLS